MSKLTDAQLEAAIASSDATARKHEAAGEHRPLELIQELITLAWIDGNDDAIAILNRAQYHLRQAAAINATERLIDE